MLHSVGKVKGLFAGYISPISEHLADVLEGELVALTGFIGLGSAHKGFDVVGLVLENVCGVFNGAVEI
jgi:hypothetical protein